MPWLSNVLGQEAQQGQQGLSVTVAQRPLQPAPPRQLLQHRAHHVGALGLQRRVQRVFVPAVAVAVVARVQDKPRQPLSKFSSDLKPSQAAVVSKKQRTTLRAMQGTAARSQTVRHT